MNPPAANPHPVLAVMGVSGAGKTTISLQLASRLGWPFEEGDSLHSPANVAKMHAGIPLTDSDLWPWLAAVAAWIDTCRAKDSPGIITCSALKRSYRAIIIGERMNVHLVYLRGSPELIAERLAHREGHFMPADLLQSQFDTLEEPGPEENPLVVEIGPSAAALADQIIQRLDLHASGKKGT
jgi:ribose 5-phosphate isomerase A